MAYIICDNCISIISTTQPACPCGKAFCDHDRSEPSKPAQRSTSTSKKLTFLVLTAVFLLTWIVQR